MTEFLYSVFGPYTFEAYSLILTYLETQVCILFFGRHLKKGTNFLLRLGLSLLLCVAFCYGLSVLYTLFHNLAVRVFCYLSIAMLNLATCLFCYRDNTVNKLLTYCSGSAAYQIAGKLYPLMQNIMGINDRQTISMFHSGHEALQDWEWLFFIGCLVLMYWGLSVAFRPKTRLIADKTTTRNVTTLSIATILIVNVLICISRVYENESFALNIVIKLFSIGFGFVALIMCAGILSRSEREQQISILNQLWKQDMAQFESVKANMDIINMKCHNLKHIIGKIENKLTEEEVASLQDAIQFYDSNIKTGNKVLDVVLCEKAMLCQRNGIRFFCMADGQKLTFLTPVQTYTLFGNIIDNAVEAVQQVENPDNHLISLLCRENNGFLEIEESNYFDGPLVLEDNLPATSKDNPNQHGFGIMSIKHIAQLYGGKFSVHVEDNMFFLRIRFPLPPKKIH